MTILNYLEKTASAHMERVAVDDGNIRLTWRELLKLSKRMGHTFSKRTKPGNPIVIMSDKSVLTLAAMFGTVYAGCFYVIADPSQPAVRLQEIFKVLNPQLVVTSNENKSICDRLKYKNDVILFKDAMLEEVNEKRLLELRNKIRETDLLYGIFTSGSTGTPKGIVVSHKAVIDFISHFTEIFGFTEHDIIGNQAPFDFDVSVKDIYTSVMTGAELVLIPKKMFSVPTMLLDYLCDKKVNTLIWAVSALVIVSSLKGLEYKIPKDIKRIMFSGEVMPAKQLRLWQKAFPDASFVNLYGPTEITCNCTYFKIDRSYNDYEKIPIGKAFPGREVFLLDEDGKRIINEGEIGEICVAGESLSAGYYNNKAETDARFVYNPDENIRYYKTGDLGSYGSSGELYFSGRKDFQVKHMGHRIELEEIEHVFNRIKGIERSVCLMDYKRNQITAFYCGEAESAEVRKQAKKMLPMYMVPRKIIKTDVMPLTKNGKTDRGYFKTLLEGDDI